MNGKQKFIKVLVSYVIKVIQVTTVANMAILPFLIYHFQNVPFISVISNMLVGPIFAIVLIVSFVLVIVCVLFPIPSILAHGVQMLFRVFLGITHVCAIVPFGNLRTIVPTWCSFFCYYIGWIGIRWLILHKKAYPRVTVYLRKKGQQFLVFLCMTMLVMRGIQIYGRAFTIAMIDVGQGDSTLIQTKRGITVLIDGGGAEEESDFKVGERITVPYLLHQGIQTIDYMMVSHFDSDHCGGLFAVLENIRVKCIIMGKQDAEYKNCTRFLKLAKEKKVKVLCVQAGDSIHLDQDTCFQILWPDSKQMVLDNGINNNSIVAKLIYGDFSMLFTGDIEEKAEKEILKKYKSSNILNCTILKVAHHGSKTSSIQAFLDEVKPRIVLIGVGKNNRFGHPNEQTLVKLRDMHCKIYRTDLNGEIRIMVKHKGKIKVQKFIE